MFIPYQSILIPLVEFMPISICTEDYPAWCWRMLSMGIPITTLTFEIIMPGIPKELIEAAKIDGCGLLSSYWHSPADFTPGIRSRHYFWQFTPPGMISFSLSF